MCYFFFTQTPSITYNATEVGAAIIRPATGIRLKAEKTPVRIQRVFAVSSHHSASIIESPPLKTFGL